MNTFRRRVRSWLEENCPPSMRTPGDASELVRGGSQQVFANPDSRLWLERMAALGWTAPAWPRAYGGGGLDAAEVTVLDEELARIHARSALQSLDLYMIGPVLLKYGSEQQKQAFVPPIVRGETLWCQGYSEPGAGSDLASLRTRATRDGEYYVVDGAKIWTSYAHYADWMFALVRTEPDAPKHQGISFLLIDMKSEGISTSPIPLISGQSPFCQVFLDGVRVPVGQLLGAPGQGWSIAKDLLQLERQMISEIGRNELGGQSVQLQSVARRYLGRSPDDSLGDGLIRQKVAGHRMNDRAFELTIQRAREGGGGLPDVHLASIFKYYGTEQNKRLYDLQLEFMGTRGLGWRGQGYTEDELQVTRDWLRSRANSIEGGTTEIQLNVIAKRILGLPD